MKSLSAIVLSGVLGAVSAFGGPLQDMINAATNGAVISVPAGTYTEAISLRDGITLVGAGADMTVIDGGKAYATVTGAKDSALIGFTVSGGRVGVQNVGNFIGVFECVITNYVAAGMQLGHGSAAVMNNLITGTKAANGIDVMESNPYVGYNIIANNNTGFMASGQLIPTLDHNVFVSNEVAVASTDGTDLVLLNNIYSGNKQNVVGHPMGSNDVVRDATAAELTLRAGVTVASYRALMKQVFEDSASMQPRITYDLTDTLGNFNLIVAYPYATFSVSASAPDTVVKAYDAYDRSNDASLHAQYFVSQGYPTVAVINPQITEKQSERFILEKVFQHPASYQQTAPDSRVFARMTNISRIEVILPQGWTSTAANAGATFEQRGGRQVVHLTDMGFTNVRVVMQKTAP